MTFSHPPEYFPGVAFWGAALRADRVVLLGGAQYVRQSFHNRARIRKPGGAQWLSIPVSRGQLGRSIVRTEVAEGEDWWRHHRKALRFNYGGSPFWEHYAASLEEVDWGGESVLSGITCASVGIAARWLGFAGPINVDPETPPAVPREPSLDGRPVVVRELRYRQVFDGFVAGLSVLDLVFCLGPRARDRILEATSHFAEP